MEKTHLSPFKQCPFVENVRGLLVYWNCKEHVLQVSLQSVVKEKTIQKKLLLGFLTKHLEVDAGYCLCIHARH